MFRGRFSLEKLMSEHPWLRNSSLTFALIAAFLEVNTVYTVFAVSIFWFDLVRNTSSNTAINDWHET